MDMAFNGELLVDGGDFALRAERLIVREGEIAFSLVGQDSDGDFRMESRAVKTLVGTYVAVNAVYRYEQWRGDYKATLEFSIIKMFKSYIELTGRWLQGGEEWRFRGHLKPFRAKRKSPGK